MPAPVEDEILTRFLPLRASKVDVSDSQRQLKGYAMVFNTLSQDLGGFKERIAPSAVDRTLRSGKNVDALVDHRQETTSILGSTDSGLLRLDKDRTGLSARIDPPDTGWVRDLITVVKAGLVKGMSFRFRIWPDGQEWEEEKDGLIVRTITDMEFSEISVVVNPAYLATDISARSAVLDRQAFEAFQALRWKPSLKFREQELRAKGIR